MSNFTKDYRQAKKKSFKKVSSIGDEKIRGLRFLIVGILIIIGLSVFRITQEVRLSFYDHQVDTKEYDNPPPAHINIPRFKLSLGISSADIEDGVWSIDEMNANYLTSSSSPGNPGNIVIYGHNSNDIFGPLRWTDVGDDIIITNTDGTQFSYTISNIVEANPDDVDWVNPKDIETLTIYTCSGFLNKKRHIVIAYPKTE